jgi:hypothetical protein
MTETTDFEVFNTGKKWGKSNYIDPFGDVKRPYPVVSSILTPCMAKIPYITTKKKKIICFLKILLYRGFREVRVLKLPILLQKKKKNA